MSAGASLLAWITELLDSGEPISFFDAFAAVRRVRRLGDIEAPVLAALIALHDSPAATDGARETLAHFLRACAERRAGEQRLAGRPIRLADSGKTARAVIGDTLRLELDENAAVGFLWQVTYSSSGLHLERLGRAASATPVAIFALRLSRAGRARLTLVEARPAEVEAVAKETVARHFELTVVVEAGSS